MDTLVRICFLLLAYSLPILCQPPGPRPRQTGQCQLEGSIELAGDPSPFKGRVVYCHIGQKRDLCAYGEWDDPSAVVVCRQLGLPTEGAHAVNFRYGEVTNENYQYALLVNGVCTGQEPSLQDCVVVELVELVSASFTGCSYVGVQCGTVINGTDVGPMECQEGEIDLIDRLNGMFGEGQLRLCVNGTWRDVCTYQDVWSDVEAELVCTELGFPNGDSIVVNHGFPVTTRDIARALPVLFDCSENETSIRDCLHIDDADSEIQDCNYAAVSCRADMGPIVECMEGEVDLVDPSDVFGVGQLRLCVNGTRRDVCIIGTWSEEAADLVCGELELPREDSLAFYYGYPKSPEERDRALPVVDTCNGDETAIDECLLLDDVPSELLQDCNYAGVYCIIENSTSIASGSGGDSAFPFIDLTTTDGVETFFLPNEDQGSSDAILIPVGFPFGRLIHSYAYVTIDGLISFDEPYTFCCAQSFPRFTYDVSLVAPFWSDVDLRSDGQILYEVHDENNIPSQPLLRNVSSFISARTGASFEGTWMLVAEWDEVYPYPHIQSTSSGGTDLENSYQAVLVTNGADQSYAMFTYECGEMEWHDFSVIGYQDQTEEFYANHPLSETNNILTIACQDIPQSVWTNLVYNLTNPSIALVINTTEYGKRCNTEVNVSSIALQGTGPNYGYCEPYEKGTFLCDSTYTTTDNVYISYSQPDQQTVQDGLNQLYDSGVLDTVETYCRELITNVLCTYHYTPCTIDSILPISLCREECTFVQETCPESWELVQSVVGAYLVTVVSPQINCSDTSANIYPQAHCCSDGGINMSPAMDNPTTSSAEQVLVPATASAGSIFFVVLVIVLVIVIVVLWMKLKQKRHESPRYLGRSVPAEDGELGDLATRRLKPNPYTMYSRVDNQGKPATSRLPPEFLEEFSQAMMIPKDNIRLLDSIGQGEFGLVYKAHLMTGTSGNCSVDVVAVKTLKGFFNEDSVKEMIEESIKMMSFDHPHVLNLIGICVDGGPSPYIVMPFMANGSLLSYLKNHRADLVLPEDADCEKVTETQKRIMDMSIQIAKGMEYLAMMKFVHRDLAARNCMIDANFVIKVADFGLSEDVYERNYFRQGQSAVKLPIKWMAIESITDMVFSEKTDVWSFGVTCWEIFSGGKTPYPGIDSPTLVDMLENGRRMDKPKNAACHDAMFTVMLNCWDANPLTRPCFADLVETISNHLEPLADYLDVTAFSGMANTTGGDLHEVESKENINQ